MKILRIIAMAVLCLPSQVWAEVTITDGWVRLLPPMVKTTAAYMTITSPQDDVLIAAKSPRVEKVELHLSSMSDGVMSMDHVEKITLKQGQTFELSPGGYHLMLMGLKKSLSEGDLLPLSLVFEKQGKVDVEVPVRR